MPKKEPTPVEEEVKEVQEAKEEKSEVIKIGGMEFIPSDTDFDVEEDDNELKTEDGEIIKDEIGQPMAEEPAPAPETRRRAAASAPKQSRRAAQEAAALERADMMREGTDELALRTAIQRSSIMSGVVDGTVVKGDATGRELCASVVLKSEDGAKSYKVLIPFGELFTTDLLAAPGDDMIPASGGRRRSNSPSAIIARKDSIARRLNHSEIQFCITSIECNEQGYMVLVASRKKAMQILSERTFGSNPPRYKAGDVVSATLTAVTNHTAVLHFAGCDVPVVAARMTRRFNRTLHDLYKVGDTVRAVIRSVEKNDSGVYKLDLDPVSVELQEAKSRYHFYEVGEHTFGVVTAVLFRRDQDGNPRLDSNGKKLPPIIYAYNAQTNLFFRVTRMNSNTFGHPISIGDELTLTIRAHGESGLLIADASYAHGTYGLGSSIYGI